MGFIWMGCTLHHENLGIVWNSHGLLAANSSVAMLVFAFLCGPDWPLNLWCTFALVSKSVRLSGTGLSLGSNVGKISAILCHVSVRWRWLLRLVWDEYERPSEFTIRPVHPCHNDASMESSIQFEAHFQLRVAVTRTSDANCSDAAADAANAASRSPSGSSHFTSEVTGKSKKYVKSVRAYSAPHSFSSTLSKAFLNRNLQKDGYRQESSRVITCIHH